ncbi:hypothetical protein ACWIUD_08385 [Helicobacter sp. 23-1044]
MFPLIDSAKIALDSANFPKKRARFCDFRLRFCENCARFCEFRSRFCELSYAVIARLACKSWQSIFKKWIATKIRYAHFLAMTKFKQILRFSFEILR